MLVIASLLMACGAATASGQTSETPQHAAPSWELGAFVGVGDRVAVRGTEVNPERQKLLVAIHAVGSLLRFGRWSFAYAADVMPLVTVTNDPRYVLGDVTIPALPPALGTVSVPGPVETGRGPAFGAALSPIGFESTLTLTPRWRAYVGGEVGVVWFTRDVPVPESRAFNYTAAYGGGLKWAYRPGHFLRIGYMFHHLSNAGTGTNNPGLNGHLLTIGVSRTIGH